MTYMGVNLSAQPKEAPATRQRLAAVNAELSSGLVQFPSTCNTALAPRHGSSTRNVHSTFIRTEDHVPRRKSGSFVAS